MSNLIQMLGLTVQNFLSAATGIAVAFALIRGFARRETQDDRQFLGRSHPHHALPAAAGLHRLRARPGLPRHARRRSPARSPRRRWKAREQVIALGPVASQIAIKMLGTNGGGFFNANAAHPFENPGDLSNLIQMLSIFALGAGLTWTLRQGGRQHQAGLGDPRRDADPVHRRRLDRLCRRSRGQSDPSRAGRRCRRRQHGGQGGPLRHRRLGAVRGRHHRRLLRRGQRDARQLHRRSAASSRCSTCSSARSIIGGVGAGLYGFLLFAILAIFVAGLMVGRTPEYVGKKIEAREVKLAVLAIAVLPLCDPRLHRAGVGPAAGPRRACCNQGPHGFTRDALRLFLGDRRTTARPSPA